MKLGFHVKTNPMCNKFIKEDTLSLFINIVSVLFSKANTI